MADITQKLDSEKNYLPKNERHLERNLFPGKSLHFIGGASESGRIKKDSSGGWVSKKSHYKMQPVREKRGFDNLFMGKMNARRISDGIFDSNIMVLGHIAATIDNMPKLPAYMRHSIYPTENYIPYDLAESMISRDENPELLLEEAIEKSKYIYGLEDDWDENNSPGYTYENWEKAVMFLLSFSKWIRVNLLKNMQVPKIYQGPNGSIDILWEDTEVKIFFNIDGDSNKGTFYSYYGDAQKSGGEFELNDFDFNTLPLPVNI
ncbi:hypothetical protein [Flavobacterium johnsoniae]|uniref:Uncharacterized protein n=1 Tax=Flavobacterium johnsoniae TaxID=986 RepID=A0A1J7CNF9_FLAJO|nr:hypothetical protein [Flavobacterium johnsoniae]OIV41194.1 hypothetical protein BKM63_11605 [Flavobacterium johnsoniae]